MDFDFLLVSKNEIMWGFLTTLNVSVVALILSLCLGILIAIFRISKNRLLKTIGSCYVEFLRNTPLLVQVYFFYFGLGVLGVNAFSRFWIGSFGLALYTSAYIAEIIRGGITSVHVGQFEAARSSGLTHIQTMRFVILPQAFRFILPSLGNQFINLVKNSAILAIIAGGDLLYVADNLTSEEPVGPVYLVTALLYLIITIPLSLGVNYLERRWRKQSRK